MMIGTMRQSGLYPPLYRTRPFIEREAVVVFLLNESRPSAWEQVSNYIDRFGSIGNAEVRRILGTGDTLTASHLLRSWRDLGLLVVMNPHEGKRVRRYTKPDRPTTPALFSIDLGKRSPRSTQVDIL